MILIKDRVSGDGPFRSVALPAYLRRLWVEHVVEHLPLKRVAYSVACSGVNLRHCKSGRSILKSCNITVDTGRPLVHDTEYIVGYTIRL